MLNTKFTPWPCFSQEEADIAASVIKSNKVNYWTGEEGRSFEKEFAAWLSCDYAVAVSNGTAALELALRALGVGVGDEVIVPSRTFIATASAVVACGAKPIFADVDIQTQGLSAETITKAVSDKTKAVICVHLAGWPCDMDPILELAASRAFYIIEDCAQAHGAKYKGRSVGTIGDIAAWSFCQDKIMTTAGEGGMVTTNSRELWSRVWSYKDHGKDWDRVYKDSHAPGFRWLHSSFGSNMRMPEVQAAIGRVQLKKMDAWHAERIRNAQSLLRATKGHELFATPEIPLDIEHAFYKCYLMLQTDRLAQGWSRDRMIDEIVSRGVPCFSGSCSEIYLEKAFVDGELCPNSSMCNARELGGASLMFLVHPGLLPEEVQKTISVALLVADLALG